jgi:glycerol kinase
MVGSSNLNFLPFIQGSVAIAGAAVSWLRDNVGIIKSSQEIGEPWIQSLLHFLILLPV